MTPDPIVNLPYFDGLLEQIDRGNAEALQAFGRHVHWGYWDDPAKADGSIAGFVAATEALCQRVCDAGQIGGGSRVLDCGCGFGGTIASLNERFSQMQLVGLNIDDRQLARARTEVQAQRDNTIAFVQGDACQLPFADGSFDVVLAVECIFHFPSRLRFFQEARRVLRSGGKLALCDFVPLSITLPLLKLMDQFAKSAIERTYGPVNSQVTIADYRTLATTAGFSPISTEDITRNTLPTYPLIRQLMRQTGTTEMEQVTQGGEWVSRLGLSRYLILAYEVC